MEEKNKKKINIKLIIIIILILILLIVGIFIFIKFKNKKNDNDNSKIEEQSDLKTYEITDEKDYDYSSNKHYHFEKIDGFTCSNLPFDQCVISLKANSEEDVFGDKKYKISINGNILHFTSEKTGTQVNYLAKSNIVNFTYQDICNNFYIYFNDQEGNIYYYQSGYYNNYSENLLSNINDVVNGIKIVPNTNVSELYLSSAIDNGNTLCSSKTPLFKDKQGTYKTLMITYNSDDSDEETEEEVEEDIEENKNYKDPISQIEVTDFDFSMFYIVSDGGKGLVYIDREGYLHFLNYDSEISDFRYFATFDLSDQENHIVFIITTDGEVHAFNRTNVNSEEKVDWYNPYEPYASKFSYKKIKNEYGVDEYDITIEFEDGTTKNYKSIYLDIIEE